MKGLGDERGETLALNPFESRRIAAGIDADDEEGGGDPWLCHCRGLAPLTDSVPKISSLSLRLVVSDEINSGQLSFVILY